MAKFSDNDLFQQIKEGNQTAFEILFLAYYKKLCSYAKNMLHRDELAEEVVQDMFVKVWEYRSRININDSVKSYLYKMVQNACLNELKNLEVERNNLKKWQLANKYAEILSYVSNDQPINNLIVKDTEEIINKALNNLPNQCRHIFMLYRFKDMNYNEIANELNLSVNTVKTQIRRAIAKLRESLKEFFTS